MRRLWLNVVATWAIAMAGSSWAVASEDYVEQSIRQHKNWIQSCTNSALVVSRSGLILYTIILGSNGDDVIRCLLSGRDTNAGSHVSDNKAAVAYPSPFDVAMLGDGPPRQMFEVLIQTSAKALVVSGVGSDTGVTLVTPVSGNAFIVQTGYSTHDRVYLVLPDSGESTYVTNGEVEIVDSEKFVFRVKGRKSYFNVGGAFWFDAIVDRDGNILDVVTPAEGNDIVCMSREQLARESNLDLSRIDRRDVCILRH